MKTNASVGGGLLAVAFVLALSLPAGAAEPALRRARDLKWADFPAVKGASRAPLTTGAATDGEGALYRLPINLPLTREAIPTGSRVLVLRGAIGVEVGGRELGEFGPGSFVAIPAGAKHVLTASAAGECTFALLPAPAAGGAAAATVASRARDLRWADFAAVKGAREAVLWDGTSAAGRGALLRLPINLPLTREAQPGTARLIVLTGAISVEIAGRECGEFGPGSFVAVPAAQKHVLTASAAGECTFLLAQDGAN
jgi:quercetin dioxygenase-like cupin family protein